MSSQVLQVTPHIVGLVVLMSSQVLQATSHVVGLITLSTGTQTLSHQGSKLIHLLPVREVLGHSDVQS